MVLPMASMAQEKKEEAKTEKPRRSAKRRFPTAIGHSPDTLDSTSSTVISRKILLLMTTGNLVPAVSSPNSSAVLSAPVYVEVGFPWQPV